MLDPTMFGAQMENKNKKIRQLLVAEILIYLFIGIVVAWMVVS
jgi:hypothetical protein